MIIKKPVRTLKLTETNKETMKFLLNEENTLKCIDITATKLDKTYLDDLSKVSSQQHHLTNVDLSFNKSIG